MILTILSTYLCVDQVYFTECNIIFYFIHILTIFISGQKNSLFVIPTIKTIFLNKIMHKLIITFFELQGITP